MSSGAVGLVLARPTRLFGVEPFFMELIGGVEETFADRGLSILLNVVGTLEAELDAYRRWAATGVADAVIVLNLTQDDPRPAVLADLGLPAVVVGTWSGTDVPVVGADDIGPVHVAVERLVELGHRRIARVSGPASLLHTQRRTQGLQDACAAAGIVPLVLEGAYTEQSGLELTRTLLESPEPPTAILYDNDVMALGGLHMAEELGVDVPGELSIVAWDDSTPCRLAHPPLTVMAVDVHQYGCIVAEAVLDLLDGKPPVARQAPVARLIERGSTGAGPAA